MKRLLILSALTASFAASATTYFQDWAVSDHNFAYTESVESDERAVLVGVGGFMFVHTEPCDINEEPSEVIWRVNDKPVRFTKGCLESKKIWGYTTISKEAANLLIEEFMVSDAVTVGNYTYSAMGFTDAMVRILHSESNAI